MTRRNKRFRFRALSSNWEQFLLSVMFHLLMPLSPLLLEYCLRGEAATGSTTLVAALFALNLGCSSRSALAMGLGIVTAVTFGAMFGVTLSQTAEMPTARGFALLAITLTALIHAAERFNRHVNEGAFYFEFMSN